MLSTSPMPDPVAGPTFWELEVRWRDLSLDPRREDRLAQIASLPGSLPRSEGADLDVAVADVYYLRGDHLGPDEVDSVASALLVDPVTQHVSIKEPGRTGERSGDRRIDAGAVATVLQKPGVMDPAEASFLQGLGDLGLDGVEVRTAVRYLFLGPIDQSLRRQIAEKVLANPAIQDVFWSGEAEPAPFRRAAPYSFEYREVPLTGLSGTDLERLSADLGL